MQNNDGTRISPFSVRRSSKLYMQDTSSASLQWEQPVKPRRSEELLKNFAVAAALALCAVTLRNGALPELTEATDAVLTAAADHSLLDEQLGKLSFVGALFPETMLVYGEYPVSLDFQGELVHAWSETEPYSTFNTNSSSVYAAAGGEVTGIYHGNDDERVIKIAGNDHLTYLYGNLREAAVSIGDSIAEGELIGVLEPGEDLVVEVQKHGISIDPCQISFR